MSLLSQTFTNEEFEELLSEIMMPETDSTIHNIRQRTFDLIEPSKNHVNFLWTELNVKQNAIYNTKDNHIRTQ